MPYLASNRMNVCEYTSHFSLFYTRNAIKYTRIGDDFIEIIVPVHKMRLRTRLDAGHMKARRHCGAAPATGSEGSHFLDTVSAATLFNKWLAKY
jgi:hypothetical protein